MFRHVDDQRPFAPHGTTDPLVLELHPDQFRRIERERHGSAANVHRDTVANLRRKHAHRTAFSDTRRRE